MYIMSLYMIANSKNPVLNLYPYMLVLKILHSIEQSEVLFDAMR